MEITLKENTVYKIGNDVLQLSAFQETINPSFIRRVYTEKEKAYAQSFSEPNLRYASTFAAKEAIYKAVKQFDTNIKLPWKKIEITRAKVQGKPRVSILLADYQFDISLTISHDGDYVWAVALVRLSRYLPARGTTGRAIRSHETGYALAWRNGVPRYVLSKNF